MCKLLLISVSLLLYQHSLNIPKLLADNDTVPSVRILPRLDNPNVSVASRTSWEEILIYLIISTLLYCSL